MRTSVEPEPSPPERRERPWGLARVGVSVASAAVLLAAGLAMLRAGLPSTSLSTLELDIERMNRALEWIERRAAEMPRPITLAFEVERGHHPNWAETPEPSWAEHGVAGPPEILDSAKRGLFVCAIPSPDGFDLFCASSGPNARFESPTPFRGALGDDILLRRSIRSGERQIK